MTPPIRALIVDDEPLARTHIRTLLSAHPDVVVVGECGNGRDAVAAIREHLPDLVFLDVQMPELDGFGVVRTIGVENMPVVVFVTAYDEYALDAFRVYALDYLLKPVNRARFYDTLGRAKAQIQFGRNTPSREQLAALVEQLSARTQHLERLAIKVNGRIRFLNIGEIDWIEAVDDYARIHAARQVHLVRDTLTRLESRLPPGKFLRIHRSTIVNVDRIKEVQTWFQGDYLLILTDGTQLTSGRSYRQKVQRFLQQSS